MRTQYVVGNLKMNISSRDEMRQYLGLLKREAGSKNFASVRGIICPPAPYLSEMTHLPEGMSRGAQNIFFEKNGAYTGEISASMVKDDGAEYVIIGHSERRTYGKETDEEVHKKTLAALKSYLTPIVCIGETREERDADQTETLLENQVRTIFQGISKLQAESIMLAYEPRWAIGGTVPPTTGDILQVRVMLRKVLTDIFDATTAERITIIYGGSVKSGILPSVSWEAGMDGVLVGRESLFPYEIVKMMTMLEENAKNNAEPETRAE